MDYPLPEVGQVWDDMDPRCCGRQIVIDRVTSLYVYVTVVRNAHAAKRSSCGQKYRILLDRLRPGTSGYRLAED